jgi:hypothetical protein
MKTSAWIPAPDLAEAGFGIDEDVVFFSAPAKVNKRTTLIGALLAAGAYAGMNLSFEIRNAKQDVLINYEPGVGVSGYHAIRDALMTVAVHLDNRAQMAVTNAVNSLKGEAVLLYEKGVLDGIEIEQQRLVTASVSETGVASADNIAETSEAVPEVAPASSGSVQP